MKFSIKVIAKQIERQPTAMELLSLAVESFRKQDKLLVQTVESTTKPDKLPAHQVESLFTRLKVPATANIAIK